VASPAASSPRRSLVGSRSGFCFTVASDLDNPPSSSLLPAMLLRGDLCEWVHAGGSAVCGAPGGAAVKSSLGRAWSDARALPRHAA
jgi:hypothetical protein